MPRSSDQFEELREKSKEKIMYAAVQLFSSIGYFSTSVSNIAEKAGVSKGLIYNYFDSKERVLESIIERAFEEAEKIFTFTSDKLPPRKRLENIINRLFDTIRMQSDFMRMVIPVAMQVRRLEFVQAIGNAKFNRMRKELEDLLTELGYEDAHGEAHALSYLFDGVVLNYALFEDDFPFEEMRTFLLNKYIHAYQE